MTSFADLGLAPRLSDALAAMGIVEPTPIQAAAIPELLAGRDVVGQARTGSGKTLAFTLPILSLCDPAVAAPQAIVVVPTRELAGQVAQVVDALSPRIGLRAAQIYGGRDMDAQLTLLHSGPQIIVGTPGRILDHLYKGSLSFRHLRFLVLDEADQMLDVGFAPDVERILDCAPQQLQVALFSATMPEWVHRVISHRLHEPAIVAVDERQSGPAQSIEHAVVEVAQAQKLQALRFLLDRRGDSNVIIFARTKQGVERLARQLQEAGYPVAALQGNMGQADRERVLRSFRRGQPPILVATNVAARGLDILSIEHVINVDLPESAELLTHRLGRTGRMGREGDAVTLVSPPEMRKWRAIERQLGAVPRRMRWEHGDIVVVGEEGKEPAPAAKRVQRHSVPCADCGQAANVNFAPRPDQPVYCTACFRRRKSTHAA